MINSDSTLEDKFSSYLCIVFLFCFVFAHVQVAVPMSRTCLTYPVCRPRCHGNNLFLHIPDSHLSFLHRHPTSEPTTHGHPSTSLCLLLLFLCSWTLAITHLWLRSVLGCAPPHWPSLWSRQWRTGHFGNGRDCQQGTELDEHLHLVIMLNEDKWKLNSQPWIFCPSQVAGLAGLQNQGQIGQLKGHYLLCSLESETELKDGAWSDGIYPGEALATHPHVLWYSQERVLSRSKRSMAFNDPRYPKQWHLVSSYTIAMVV